MSDERFPIERHAGPPSVTPVDLHKVDERRRAAFVGWEKFLRDRLDVLEVTRSMLWRRDYTSVTGYERSIAAMRAWLQRTLGFWMEPEARPPVQTSGHEVLCEQPDFTAQRFIMELLPGWFTYAVELIPRTGHTPRPGLLLQHGYGGTPEAICGLTANTNGADYAYRELGLRAVRRGYHVLAVFHPAGYGQPTEVATRVPQVGTSTAAPATSTPVIPAPPPSGPALGHNRLHRYATLAGGTLFGLYMFASSRGVDYLTHVPGNIVDPARIGMYGLSQGGQSALYLAALDPRIAASVCSAYFNQRLAKLIGPHRAAAYIDWVAEDAFVPDFVRIFSDADLASLICPRAFAVEAGERDTSVDFEKARAEFAVARTHFDKLGLAARAEFIAHSEGHICATARAFEFLGAQLGLTS